MHYYKRNLGDYAKKAGRLSMLQHGAYTLLIDACYDRERFPTIGEAIEWAWASTQDEIDAVKFVLAKFFTLGDDGVYTQDRILEELIDYHTKADKNKQIAIDRETKRKQNSTNRARTVHEAAPDKHEPPPNQEPRTKNHKPEEDKSSSRGAYAPPEWVPADPWIEFVRMRKAMRNVPFTAAAAKGVVNELDRLRAAGHDPGELLTISVTNGWRTVYPPKTINGTAPKNTGRHSGFDQLDYTTGVHEDGSFA